MSSIRTCSYCLRTGHNRRTCNKLKADMDSTRQAAKVMRGMFAEALTENGIAPGALLQVRVGGGWNSEPYDEVFMVRNVNLDHIASVNSWRNQASISLVKLKNFKSRRNMSLANAPMTQSFAFMKRHNDENLRWNSDSSEGFYVAKEHICKVLKPSRKLINYEDYLTNETKESFNFKPASYREEDKWRYDSKMAAIYKFLEKYGK